MKNSKSAFKRAMTAQEMERIVRELVFGKRDPRLWKVYQIETGTTITILSEGFTITVCGVTYSFSQIEQALRRSGFSKLNGSEYHTPTFWEPGPPCKGQRYMPNIEFI